MKSCPAMARVGLEPAEHLVAAHLRHDQVEQHEVEPVPGEEGERLGAAGREDRGAALPFDPPAEQLAVGGVVVHDEDASEQPRLGMSPGGDLGSGSVATEDHRALAGEPEQATGGVGDAPEVGRFRGAERRARVLQPLELRDRPAGRRPERVAQLPDRRRAVYDDDHLPSHVQDPREARGPVGVPCRLRVLQQHLAAGRPAVPLMGRAVPAGAAGDL
jgi:hypothetical protein